jgi:hypothetical protein
MTNYSLIAGQRVSQRLDRHNERKRKRQERARRLLEKLRGGAVLYRHHHNNRAIWCLVGRRGSEFLTHEVVTDAMASGHVVGVGDCLFAGAPSQTYRYVE